MDEKVYYSIGEVSEMFNVNQSLIRFWETEFSTYIKPKRNKRGVRSFTKKDIENISIIYDLVKVKKYTLDGAKKELKNLKKSSKEASNIEKEKQIKKIEEQQKVFEEQQKALEKQQKALEEQQRENEKVKTDNSKLQDELLEKDKRMESLKYNHRAVYDKLIKIRQLAEQLLNKE